MRAWDALMRCSSSAAYALRSVMGLRATPEQEAVLRRAGGFQKLNDKRKLTFEGLSIDRERMEVISGGRLVTFTTKEFELLYFLACSPGKVYSRNQLLESIWGYTYFGDTRTVDTHIKRIRQKLAIPRDSAWDIETVWGVGYKFELKAKSSAE